MRMPIIIISKGFMLLGAAPSPAQSRSNDGQLYDLKSSYACEPNEQRYGRFHVWGSWTGGQWCGSNMPSGYYVYKNGSGTCGAKHDASAVLIDSSTNAVANWS
jgi:hypothetical protein